MTTEQQLRETLGAHVEGAPGNSDRIGQVRGRIRAHRQRRAAGTALALAVVAAAVVVPLTTAGRGSATHVQPIATPPEQQPAGYAYGGRAIGSASGRSSPAQPRVTFTVRPTSYLLVIATDCGGDLSAEVAVAVNGHELTEGSCGAQLGQVADAGAARVEWQRVIHLDAPNTVTVTRLSDTNDDGHLAATPVPTGTVGGTVYQGVPFTAYPLPPDRVGTYPFPSGDSARTELDSRTVGADGTFTFSATTGAKAGFELELIGPGLVDIAVDGQHLQTYGSYDYGTQDDGYALSAEALAAQYGVHLPNGKHVTVTVTASDFAGPYWRVTARTPR